jgi:RNA polymerase sigma-70 factor (ECF subfamily)
VLIVTLPGRFVDEEQNLTATAQRTNPRPLPRDFEQLFQEHRALVYRAAYRITGTAEDAEDVLQTLFLRLLRRDHALDFGGNPKGYLHRAAVNIALDVIRLRRPSIPPDESIIVDDRTGLATESQQLVLAALSELSPKLAEMFVLKHVEGYNNGEIARLIGTSRGAVAVMLFRARVRLKRSIRSQLGGGPASSKEAASGVPKRSGRWARR